MAVAVFARTNEQSGRTQMRTIEADLAFVLSFLLSGTLSPYRYASIFESAGKSLSNSRFAKCSLSHN